MQNDRSFEFLDILVVIVKWKKFLILLFITSMILSYLTIYFFVDERYSAQSLLLPSGEDSGNSLLSGLSGLKGIPFNLGGLNSNTDVDLYNSIVFSRSLLDNVISKFDLVNIYKIDTSQIDHYEKTLKRLRGSISAGVNDDGMTYNVSVTAPSALLAAKMTNYIVKLLNDKIVELKIKKSTQNRIFLAERVNEIKDSLKYAENKLEEFQEKTGMFEAENQTKAILEQYAQLQAQLAEKQTEYAISKKVYGLNSPQTTNARIVANEFSEKLKSIENGKDSTYKLLSLNKLPQKALNYFRLFRDVQIYSNILEFELPLYEQAKFQEQKDVPILQVIDPAIPPAKRSFPKRTIMAFLITMVLMLISLVFLLLKENKNLAGSNEYLYIKNNLFKWKSQDYKS